MNGTNYFPHLLEVLPDRGDATVLTLELLWRAAPEQVEELDDLFAKGIQARIARGQSPALGVTFNVLQIPTEVLQQLWLLAHAAWHDLVEFYALKADPTRRIDRTLILKTVDACTQIANAEAPDWPPSIPRFNEVADGVEAKAVRELYAMAAAWAILHEMAHAKLFEDDNRPGDPKSEEMLCDSYAAEFLLAKIDKYSDLTGEAPGKVRGKRAMASLVGLYFVARLSAESARSETHPPVRDRIKLLFDRVGEQEASHFWSFAVALLWGLKPAIATEGVRLENPSSRDLAYFALDAAL